MREFPRDLLTERITRERFLNDNPRRADWLDDLQPGDEIWRYSADGEGGGYGGYVVLRDGHEVKEYTNMTWTKAAPHFVLVWDGMWPSLREILAARQFQPWLRDKPIQEVRKILENEPYWDCGEAWSFMRREMEQRAKRLGLRYELRKPF